MQRLAAVTAFSLAGCGPQSPDFSILATAQSTYQGSTANNKVDLLFVIDNSGSMLPRQQKLADSLSSFANVFTTKGFDFRIAVVTTDALSEEGIFYGLPTVLDGNNYSLTAFEDKVKVGVSYSDTAAYERPLDSIIEALRPTRLSSTNTGFLRADAHLAIIAISDEDVDEGVPSTMVPPPAAPATVADTVAFLDALKPERFDVLARTYKKNYTVSAVVARSGADPECQAMTDGFEVGTKLMELASLSNGSVASICAANFSSGLTQISQRIAEAITEVPLSSQPNESTIEIRFNGVIVPKDPVNGWSYVAAGNKVVFHGNAIPTDNTSIALNFTPNDIIR